MEPPSEDIITFNVGGKLFQVKQTTFANYPLEDYLPKLISKHQGDKPTFIDRDPKIFRTILNYYRTGILDQPKDVGNELWRAECEFYFAQTKIDLIDTPEDHKGKLQSIRRIPKYFLENVGISVCGGTVNYNDDRYEFHLQKWGLIVHNGKPYIMLGHKCIGPKYTKLPDKTKMWFQHLETTQIIELSLEKPSVVYGSYLRKENIEIIKRIKKWFDQEKILLREPDVEKIFFELLH